MGIRATALLALALVCASAAAEPRPRLSGVQSVRIANYNAPSTLIESRDQVRAIVDDLNEARRKSWTRGETKLSCYSTVVLMAGKKRLGEFRVTRENIVERPVEKGQSSYSIALGPGDIANLARMLAEILPAKDCG